MRTTILLSGLLLFMSAQAQLNMTQLGYLSYFQLHNADCNDVWGYVDEVGNEYALVGTTKGFSVVDVSDPSNPSEVFWQPGMNSVWRDVKVWGDYAYVTTEAQQGLLIVDLSPLPASTSLPVAIYTGPAGNNWESAHNIWIDENGYAYINGANRGNGGIIILDVHTNPMSPIEVGEYDNWYSHDCWVQNDTLFAAHINDGFFSIANVSDKNNPVFLASNSTPGTFSHNIWGSDDLNTVFTTDEIGGGYLAAYDVSNLANISELDRTQSHPGQFVIPHNVHFLDNYIITSYYRDGIVVHDVSDPRNMIEVANFDTSPMFSGNGFNGCWGAYPYLPSGNILATDIERGLYVLGINYQRGAYLQGVVTDQSSGVPIGNAEVRLLGQNISESTIISGAYRTGIGVPGTYQVRYHKPGYFADTITVNLQSGQTFIQNVTLVPMIPFTFQGVVREAGSLLPIQNADVELGSVDFQFVVNTDASGQFSIPNFYQGAYALVAGRWGHFNHCMDTMYVDAATGIIEFLLEPGYYDDFALDLGWAASGTASVGDWERAVPDQQVAGSAVRNDGDWDCSNKAYVTGNIPGHPDLGDVDEGYVLLQSPVMDLSTYADPHVNYLKWFYCRFGPNPEDDSLKIFLNDGVQSVLIDWMSIEDEDRYAEWLDTGIRVLDHITNLTSVSIEVYTSDLKAGTDDSLRNITEAGFDYFFVSETPVITSLQERDSGDLMLSPNPASNSVMLYGAANDIVLITDMQGKLIGRKKLNNASLDVSDLPEGIYLLRLETVGGVRAQKLVVLR